MNPIEIKLQIDCEDINSLKLFSEKNYIGIMSDQDWRDYQLNKLLNITDNTIEGKVELENETVYVFKYSKSVGCLYDKNNIGIETRLSKVSHIIKEVIVSDSGSSAIVYILETTVGRELKELIKDKKAKLVPIGAGNKIFRLDIDLYD